MFKRLGDLLVRPSEDQQLEHLDLTSRQPGGQLGPPPHSLTRRGEHGVDRLAVEAPGAHLGAQQVGALALAGQASRCGRSSASAWATSATARIRAVIGMASALVPRG